MADAHPAFDPMPLAIRTAVGDGVGHALQGGWGNRLARRVNQAGDAAHGYLFTATMVMPASSTTSRSMSRPHSAHQVRTSSGDCR